MASKTKKKKAGAKSEDFIDRVEIKHTFSDAEKAEILTELSQADEQRESLIAQAKSSAKQWKAEIEKADIKRRELTMKGRNGFEMRQTDVTVTFDRKKGKKRLFLRDSGKFIEERDMTESDFQRLPMDIPPPKKEPKKGEGLTNVGDALDKAEQKEEEHGADETEQTATE